MKKFEQLMDKWFTPKVGDYFKITGFAVNPENPLRQKVIVETIKGKIFYMDEKKVLKLLEGC